MIRLHARAFWLAKEGNRSEEWEDACAYSEARSLLAVSDGASSSFRARDWASILVAQFLEAPPRGELEKSFEGWVAGCAEQFDALPASDGDAWYVEEAASRGAFATFLGLGFRPTDRGDCAEWTALAVGDTCLFQIRDGRRIGAFPLDDPDSFTSTPALLTTVERTQGYGARTAVVTRGTCVAGDTFLVATDALSKWMLRAEREDADLWASLACLRNEGFLTLMSHLRGAGAIENDDITMLRATAEAQP